MVSGNARYVYVVSSQDGGPGGEPCGLGVSFGMSMTQVELSGTPGVSSEADYVM